jgi:3-methyladenine DNA glycosylase/8-oxoguanine DNA glycosylase
VEIFQFSDEVDTYIFQLDTAKKIASDGRAALPVSQETLRAFAGMNEFDFDHLFHVDPSRPGIFTRRFGAPILLDGTHRAIRCFAKHQPFHAFELSYEESVECLLQQRISTKDAAAIVRKLRQVLEVFPSSGPVDTPLECAPETLREAEKTLTAEERRRFILRAVPVPE